MKETEQLAMAHSDGSSHDQGATGAVTICARGESVWVAVLDDNQAIYGNSERRYSSFSGFLLYVV